MRILFVIAHFSIKGGGASKMFAWVANQFAKDGHDVTIYTHTTRQTGDLFPIEPNIKVISTTPQQNSCFLYPIPHIRRIIKETSPHIVVAFKYDSNLYCILAKMFMNVPICICERGDPNVINKMPFKFKISKWMTRFTDSAVFQLQQAADFYSWIKGFKKVIPNPVIKPKVQVCKPFMLRNNEICCSSRITFGQKRQDVLIRAFKIVSESHPEMSLKLIGDGPDLETGKNLAESLGIGDKVHFIGQVNSPLTQMVDSKLFVLSSDYEGIPNSLTEAMAAGLPCISTDVSPGGARLLIDQSKNGIIVPCNNPEAMAKAIIFMLEHPDDADLMGAEAKMITERFAEERVYNMWKSFFHSIVTNR